LGPPPPLAAAPLPALPSKDWNLGLEVQG